MTLRRGYLLSGGALSHCEWRRIGDVGLCGTGEVSVEHYIVVGCFAMTGHESVGEGAGENFAR